MSNVPELNPHVFREYDIRGVADEDLRDPFVRDLGRALGTFHRRAGRRRIALARDCRLSSPGCTRSSGPGCSKPASPWSTSAWSPPR